MPETELNLPPREYTTDRNQTAQLSSWMCEVDFESLDNTTVSTVKRLISDGIAVAIAGSKEEPPGLIAAHVSEMGCKALSTVWGFGVKTSPTLAAYANAIAMHVLDFEPMSNPPAHALSPTVPVALALAEARHIDGRQIIVSCLKGFEIQGRLLLAANPERRSMAFHAPGIVGVLGATVTAAHLLDLDAPQLAHAFGIAASRCAGLHANHGSMVKATHCGNAAAAGLDAALLSKRGFTANPGILEAQDGYVATFFPKEFNYRALFDMGHPYRCVDPGMAIKFYPSKYPTQFAITAALNVRKMIDDSSSVTTIRVLTPDIADVDRPCPRNGLEGKFSFQYTVAAALLDGRVGADSFSDERRFRKDMVALLAKTSVVRNPALSRDTRNMRVEVEVTLSDGTVHSCACTKPPGFWGEPVDDQLHRAKIRDCLSARFNDSQIDRILDLLENLEHLSAQESGQLIALLA